MDKFPPIIDYSEVTATIYQDMKKLEGLLNEKKWDDAKLSITDLEAKCNALWIFCLGESLNVTRKSLL